MYVKKVRIVQSNRIIREEIHQKEQYNHQRVKCSIRKLRKGKRKDGGTGSEKTVVERKGCLSDLSKKL